MTKKPTCPQCGTPLPEDRTDGHCWACLLNLGLAGEAGGSRPAEQKVRRCFRDYELVEEISRGGMGVVYRACQLSLNRPVALKMILEGSQASPAFVARFHFEAEAAAKLNHPNIVPIYEIGEDQGRYFYSMELMEQGSLAARMGDFVLGSAGSRLGRAEALARQREIARLMATVARAVSHAHQRGILHRDLKPANILFDSEMQPHVADFGVAKLLEEESLLTQPGVLLGTPAYMAPEQAAGEHHVTIAADVYSLGAILYHLLAGQPPFQAATAVETIRQVIDKEPALPERLHPLVDRDLATVCVKCLQKEPGGRYTSARALADDLERWTRGESIVAAPRAATEKILLWCRRKPALAGLSAAVFLLILAVAIISTVAEKKTTEKLWESYLAQARALRWSGRPGRKFDSLQAIQNAARIRPSLELRNEAIAALAQTDIRPVTPEKIGLPARFAPGETVALDWRGKRFAVAEADGTIRIRAFGTLAESARLDGAEAKATGLHGFTSDGRWLGVDYGDGRSRLWNLEHEAPDRQLEHVAAYRFSPDGKRVAICSNDRTLRVFGLDSETSQFGEPARLPGVPYGLYWSPDGRFIACAFEKEILLVNPSNGVVGARMALAARPFCCAWQPDGTRLAVGGDDVQIYLFDSKSGQLMATLAGHVEAVVALSFSPNGAMLASYGWDGRLRIWDVETGGEIMSVAAMGGGGIGFSPDGKNIAAYDTGQSKVGFFEIGGNETAVNLGSDYQRHANRGDALLFDRGNRWLATSMDDALRLWQPGTGKELARHEGQPFSTLLAVAPDGVLGWLRDGFHRLSGDMTLSERFLPVIPAGLKGGWPLASNGAFTSDFFPARAGVSMDGRVAAIAIQGHCYIFDMRAGALQAITGAQSQMKYVAVSPDGALVATGGWNVKNARIWNAADGRREQELPTAGSANMAFSPDGRWLVIGTGAEYVFWHTSDWRLDHRIARPENQGLPGPMCFSRDSRILALAYDRSTVRLISPESGATLADIEPVPERQLIAMAFNSDATELAITRTAAPPQIWHLGRIRERLAAMKLDW